MKILLTGSTGFIGRHLLRHLLAGGHEVVTPGRFDPLLAIGGEFDAVIDLAWSGVPAKQRNDWIIQTGNVARFGVLLSMLPQWKPKVVIGFGSQAEYGEFADRNGNDGWFMPKPETAYGAAKLACQELLWANCPNGARNIWFRLFSVYGPGEGEDWLIPSTIRKMQNGEPLQFTAGEQEMDYLHVDDLCRAVIGSFTTSHIGECVDLASGNPVKVRTVIETLADLIKPTQPLEFGALPYRPGQLMRASANPMFWKRSGLKPTVSLRQGLQQVVDSMNPANHADEREFQK